MGQYQCLDTDMEAITNAEISAQRLHVMTRTPQQRSKFIHLMNMEALHRVVGLSRMYITVDCGQPGGTFRWINIRGARPPNLESLSDVAVFQVLEHYGAISKLSFHDSPPLVPASPSPMRAPVANSGTPLADAGLGDILVRQQLTDLYYLNKRLQDHRMEAYFETCQRQAHIVTLPIEERQRQILLLENDIEAQHTWGQNDYQPDYNHLEFAEMVGVVIDELEEGFINHDGGSDHSAPPGVFIRGGGGFTVPTIGGDPVVDDQAGAAVNGGHSRPAVIGIPQFAGRKVPRPSFICLEGDGEESTPSQKSPQKSPQKYVQKTSQKPSQKPSQKSIQQSFQESIQRSIQKSKYAQITPEQKPLDKFELSRLAFERARSFEDDEEFFYWSKA